MDTIGIIGAMEEEIRLLKDIFTCREQFEEGGVVFHLGETDRYRVVLMQCGIGKVNAAIGTTLLISRYNPLCIINTGSAGALDRELNQGDVIISSHVVHHDVDVTPFGYVMGQVPQLPETFIPEEKLVEVASRAAEEQAHLNVKKGAIASGDQFVSDLDRVDRIRKEFPEAVAAEMEAAAIGQTCHQFGKPFVIIRSISDRADSDAALSFEEFLETAAVNSARIVEGIVKGL
ncbi:MAG: 5'-methylthioadenosine/adenosylhomocysteine nucleosidase [Spirochaetales bacterium]|nr:5'-methylthioadenosine/adenosylhomocysteine nucleosidase [Spirochaetales bacterium]